MPYDQYTLGDLRAQLAVRYGSTPFWTTAEADLAINSALRQWNLTTAFWKTREILTTTANGVYYSTLGSMVHGIRLTWHEYPLIRTSVSDLDKARPNWEAETIATGSPVPPRPTFWVPCGLQAFAIWPADTGVSRMVVDGVLATPVLTAATDRVQLGQEDADALLDYVLGVPFAFKGPRDRWQILSQAGLRSFYQAAAIHRPALRLIPALAAYFTETPLREDRPVSIEAPSVSAAPPLEATR